MLLGASAAVAAALVPAGAQASGNLHLVCQYLGTSTSLVPPIQYLGDESSTTDRYAFSGTASCTGVDGGAQVDLIGLTLNGVGSYNNQVCSPILFADTGTFYGWNGSPNGGQAGDGLTLLNGATTLATANYTLPVTAGLGAIVNAAFTGSGQFAGDSGALNGTAQISPSPANMPEPPDPNNPNGGNCLTQFDIAGDLVLNSSRSEEHTSEL